MNDGEQKPIPQRESGQKPLLYFDGDCSLCNKSVQFILAHEKKEDLLFAPLSSLKSNDLVFQNTNITYPVDSIIFLENGIAYQKFDAVMRLVKYLKFPYTLFAVFKILPSSIGNIFYHYIAKNRSRWFKNSTTCWVVNNQNAARFLNTSLVA